LVKKITKWKRDDRKEDSSLSMRFWYHEKEKNSTIRIRKKQICGCEIRSEIYTYACSSMRFRGDGKSNIYNGDCYNNAKNVADNHKPTIAFLNPPYDVGTAGQLKFIEHALSVLDKKAFGARAVAIVQMSCATNQESDLLEVKK